MWRDFEEYNDWVQPSALNNPQALFRGMRIKSSLQRATTLMEKILELREATQQLATLWKKNSDQESLTKGQAWGSALEIAAAAEELFIYCEPLARTEAAGDLTSEKDLYEHWERYRGHRLEMTVPDLIAAAEAVVQEAYKHLENAGRFLDDPARELPEMLRRQFETARDLFSVECPEMAGFAALRGLEATLREIVRHQGVELVQTRGTGQSRKTPLYEADLNDIIESTKRLHWTRGKYTVSSPRVVTLLHHLRVARNVAAHPGEGCSDQGGANWREIAILAARAATSLWTNSKKGRRRIVEKSIDKNW